MFFFGPESNEPPPKLPEEPIPSAPSPVHSSTAARKVARDSVPNGLPEPPAQPATKRIRKTATGSERNGAASRKPSGSTNQFGVDLDMPNGHPASVTDARSPSATEGGVEDNGPLINGVRNDDRMDLDEESLTADQHNHEPNAKALPPPIYTLTNGSSIGIQVVPDKVANLAPSTTLLRINDAVASEESPLLTRVSWRPADSKVVTAMGDNFCKVWDLDERQSEQLDQPLRSQELVEAAETTLVSAIAWEPNGEMLAVATYSNQAGQIHLFDGQELTLMETLPASQRAITSLKWQSQGLRLLGIAPYDSEVSGSTQIGGSSILMWDLSRSPNFTGPLSVSVPEILVDMDCAFFNGNGIVCATGQRAVYHCQAFFDLVLQQKWTSPENENDQWTFVRCAWHDSMDAILVAASADAGSLWMPAQNLLKRGAHDAPITGLELRPRLPGSYSVSLKQEFATSSMDGTVKIWRFDADANSIVSVCKLIIGHASPVMTLSYSPDGFCLAGASYDTIRIWNAEHTYTHMATWKGDPNTWSGSRLRDDDMMSIGGASSVNGDNLQTSADHSMSWDADSRKLAFGLGFQVSQVLGLPSGND